MTKDRIVLLGVVLIALLFPSLTAAEPSSVVAGIAAPEAPACQAAITELEIPELPALPDQPVQPLFAACDWTCTDQCDEYYWDCVDDCPGFRGDPCLTSCRSGRISCYQSCGCL